MHSKIFAVVTSAALAFASFGAEAMPTGTIAGGASAAPHITLAAEGCGPGMRAGLGGRCRRIRGAVVLAPRVVAPRVVVAPRPVVVVAPRPVVVAPRVVVGPRVVAPRRALRRPKCGVHVPGVTVVTPC